MPDLPDVPSFPGFHDPIDDLTDHFNKVFLDTPVTPCANDETLASGEILNKGLEVKRNDIRELDLQKVPGTVSPCGVRAKKKEEKKIKNEEKKISKKVKKELKKEAERHDAVVKQKKEKAEELRQSIDYCERKPEALQFAVDMNKKQPIEKEQCYTDNTEEREKKKEKNTNTPSFVSAMMGVIMGDIEKGNEKAKHDAEAERECRYASDTSFVQWNASKGRQSSVIGGFEAFGAAAMAISERTICEDDSGTQQGTTKPRNWEPCFEAPPGPSPPPPPPPQLPKPENDNIRMPYGDVLKSDTAWSIFK